MLHYIPDFFRDLDRFNSGIARFSEWKKWIWSQRPFTSFYWTHYPAHRYKNIELVDRHSNAHGCPMPIRRFEFGVSLPIFDINPGIGSIADRSSRRKRTWQLWKRTLHWGQNASKQKTCPPYLTVLAAPAGLVPLSTNKNAPVSRRAICSDLWFTIDTKKTRRCRVHTKARWPSDQIMRMRKYNIVKETAVWLRVLYRKIETMATMHAYFVRFIK